MTEERTQVFVPEGEKTRVLSTPQRVPRLVFLNGPRQGAEVEIKGFPFTIGRSPRNDLVIPMDTVSAFHARILCEQGVYYLEDLRSRNGTFLNGERITERKPLAGGEEIRMGEALLRFYPQGESFDFRTPPDEEDTSTGFFQLPSFLSSASRGRRRLLLLGIVFLGGVGAVFLLHPFGNRSSPPRTPVASAQGGREEQGVKGQHQEAIPPSSTESVSMPASQQEAHPSSPQTMASLPTVAEHPQALPLSTPPPKEKGGKERVRGKNGEGSQGKEKAQEEGKLSPVPGADPDALKVRFREAYRRGELAVMQELVNLCTSCPEGLKTELLLAGNEPRDLPGVVRKAKALRSLLAQGWIAEKDWEAWQVQGRRSAGELLKPLILQGEFERVRAILLALQRLDCGIPPRDPLLAPMQERARERFHNGYTLERVNPEAARKEYEAALGMVPPGDPLEEQIQRRLDALR